jgi:flagellar biosynthesis chaperone FliJ
MNKERRKQINEAGVIFGKAHAMIEDAKALLQDALDEEQEYYDNMPESLQGGDKGDMAQSAISALESAIEAMEGLDDVQGYIDEAAA